jgi:hypothetical protein
MLTASHVFLSGIAHRESNPVVHCLDSWTFVKNMDRSIHDPVALAFYTPGKSASLGGKQHLLLT